jgi:hypothetical protein
LNHNRFIRFNIFPDRHLGISLVYKRQSADFKRLFKLIPLPISRSFQGFCSNVAR